MGLHDDTRGAMNSSIMVMCEDAVSLLLLLIETHIYMHTVYDIWVCLHLSEAKCGNGCEKNAF